MADRQDAPYDLTEKASKRGDEKGTRLSRELESDDAAENTDTGRVPSLEGDNNAENRVITSISED